MATVTRQKCGSYITFDFFLYFHPRNKSIFCINTVHMSLFEYADDNASTAASAAIDSASYTLSIVHCRNTKHMTGSVEVLWTLESGSRPKGMRGRWSR